MNKSTLAKRQTTIGWARPSNDPWGRGQGQGASFSAPKAERSHAIHQRIAQSSNELRTMSNSIDWD
jgi:hypothetical protein